MLKKYAFIIILIACSQLAMAEISSLSQLFLLGRGIKDLDGDNLGDKVSLSIIIPDNPSSSEIALAADIAARANFESLAANLFLVQRESEVENFANLENPVLIGSRLTIMKDILKENRIDVNELGPNQGLVFVFSHRNQRGLALAANSDGSLLKTGRAFFLRWPYFWEIWGRQEGPTYLSFENDLARFLAAEGIQLLRTAVKTALYEFPPENPAPDSLKKLSFNSGEIKNLVVEINFSDTADQQKALEALETLRMQRQKGQRTELLSYPGCAQITFELRYGKRASATILPRLGYPKRSLTPSYKDCPQIDTSGKEFDLLSFSSAKGFYSDGDRDGLLDGLDGFLIIPQNSSIRNVSQLASRMVLATTGATFPLVFLDEEIDNKRGLIAPILVGPNKLSQELLKSGKLKIPPLESAWAIAQVIPKAFNKSGALAFLAADNLGLDKILAYFSQTFPYLKEYKDGNPQLSDVRADVERFFKGDNGSAEAHLEVQLKSVVEEIKDKELEYFKAEMTLPLRNPAFEDSIKKYLQNSLRVESLEVINSALGEGQAVFEKEKEFTWEMDEALALIQEKIESPESLKAPLKISVGVSESPEVRQKAKKQIEAILAQKGLMGFEVEVLSAYKQGFFWLAERVLPALKNKAIGRMTVRFAEEKDNMSRLKRFYSEPFRWLQELYPVDEILSRELALPLEKIEFEINRQPSPVYEIIVFDDKNTAFLQQSFSPRTREIPFLKVLPEWGTSKITTGWVKIESGNRVLLDTSIQTDLEKFWDFYQDEVLAPVYSHIMKKTGNEPAFSKQPYFKRLLLELWSSEPDYKLGLDEEIVSSLESIHDEIYFDTLDFLRGITSLDTEEKEIPEDTSRYSAPGNVLPLIHPSSEGKKGKAKVIFEDWPASSPQVSLNWKTKGRPEVYSRRIVFPSFNPKSLEIPSFVYNGQEERIENLAIEVELETEAHYQALLDIIDSYRTLFDRHLIEQTFSYPNLRKITLRVKCRDLIKEEDFSISYQKPEDQESPSLPKPEERIVPTTEIISPEKCLEFAARLGRFKNVRVYSGGRSFENREVPVIEVFTPQEKYVSVPRLIASKPTLQISARQHANEVSSTNYLLRFAELLARDRTTQDSIKKINFVLQPMENPDGAALVTELQKLEPFHSLHAGRYGFLGIEIGYEADASRALVPEASVRRNLTDRWLPDIFLNLHGYPSHEWVQQFSGYSPYLFRDYWIPRGWFAYYSAISLPIYQRWKEAADDLQKIIIEDMQSNDRFKESNKKFYDRYYRWASRWQPHLDYLELTEGLNLYVKRRDSVENKLSLRTQTTVATETPELMDETARGAWLDFLGEQGLTYLRAHLKYLAQAKFETARIEEEIQNRIRIQFIRSRPGSIPKPKS